MGKDRCGTKVLEDDICDAPNPAGSDAWSARGVEFELEEGSFKGINPDDEVGMVYRGPRASCRGW